MTTVKAVSLSLAAVSLVALVAAPLAQAVVVVTKSEAKCSSKLGKGAAKLAGAIIKGTSKCLAKDISGKTVGSCPDSKTIAKMNKAKNKLAGGAAKSCGSTCSISELPCLAESLCPPYNNTHERCSALGKNYFDMGNIGFPGPYCETQLGRPITGPGDLAECVELSTIAASDVLIDVIYGGITNATGISGGAQKCLDGLSKATGKLASTIQKGVGKCRDLVNKGKLALNPSGCATDNAKTVAKVNKMAAKLSSTAVKKCTGAQVAELDICGNGVGGTSTTAAASACLEAAAREIGDSTEVPTLRNYSPGSLIEAAYPPVAVCGDGIVNQVPNHFLLLGEECDGNDDAACPGGCIPPGDVFECSCDTIRRVRYMADMDLTDLDNGWTGSSHESTVSHLAGYVTAVSDCNCSELDGWNCVGTTTDSVCTGSGYQKPACSHDPYSSTRCDGHGNLNGLDTDSDCAICDQFAANAGDWCVNEGNCQGQCYNEAGNVTGACDKNTDCTGGDVCRGQCNTNHHCIELYNGFPLPIASGGTAVCVQSRFREDVQGTTNILTGSAEQYIHLYSTVSLGVNNEMPCPVCGGFCLGGPREGTVCEGTCSGGGADSCRFTSDCPTGETCTTAAASCPGGVCNLGNVCWGGDRHLFACKVGALTSFGTTSSDCSPSAGKNISGIGLQINFDPSTSGESEFASYQPCSAPGYGNYDCPCSDDGGVKTKPNACAFACNAGPNLGLGCGSGDSGGVISLPTVCVGGSGDGAACDEDSDCLGGGACSGNPSQCSDTLATCSSDANCPAGTCGDACPGGQCVPLCVPTAEDPYEGVCAAGPDRYHCSGDGHAFRVCSKNHHGTQKLCEAGVNGVLGDDDDIPGAGICVSDIRHCFLAEIKAQGKSCPSMDYDNCEATPSTPRAGTVYCIPSTSNIAINSVAGLGGPGRLRTGGVNVGNGTTIP